MRARNNTCISSHDIEGELSQIKNRIKRNISNNRLEEALQFMNLAADIQYCYNQSYRDDELEEFVAEISKKVLPALDIKPNKNVVLFYDGFGLSSRGLAQIYVRALCKNFSVIYVTDISRKHSIPDICIELKNNAGSAIFLKEKGYTKRILEIDSIIKEFKPEIMLMYTRPDDVECACVFHSYQGKVKRFQINLTDHAYWLGCESFDYCLEFRDYGASISNRYRNIPEHKLIKLPFYPVIDTNANFHGFPFPFDLKKDRVIFSGGALYKTFGGDNHYYEMVDHILKANDNVKFWYAGFGDHSKLDELIKKYPNRVFFTPERSDLYQVLKHCTLYLSTYPICGGLMFQYAAKAGRIPLTLKFGDMSDGFLINQSLLNVEFEDIEELEQEARRLLSDNTYLHKREEEVKNAVISEDVFESQLFKALKEGETNYEIFLYDVNISRLKSVYQHNFKRRDLVLCVAKKRNMQLMKFYPKLFFEKIYQKIYQKKNKL